MDVTVQPEFRAVAVYHPDEGLEADVGVILGVSETKRWGMSNEDAGLRLPE
ncbi:MAG: hypothetical protein H0X23_10990 [Rubrobacter sp.]|nr:hypothetical protein [Rubrobacter sp.]